MSEPLDPLPPGLQALFDAERSGERVGPASADRIWHGVERAYATLPAGPPPSQPPSPTPGPRPGAGSLARALTTKKLVALGAGLFAGGAATGALVERVLVTPAPHVARAQALTTPPAPVALPPATPVPAPATPGETNAAPPVRHRAAPVAAPAAPLPAAPAPRLDSDLGAEQAQLEVARTALQRGKPLAALDALDAHLRQFPKGRLAEEREALRVQALAAAGERAAALQAARAFERDYPQSLLGPAVRAVLRQSH